MFEKKKAQRHVMKQLINIAMYGEKDNKHALLSILLCPYICIMFEFILCEWDSVAKIFACEDNK